VLGDLLALPEMEINTILPPQEQKSILLHLPEGNIVFFNLCELETQPPMTSFPTGNTGFFQSKNISKLFSSKQETHINSIPQLSLLLEW
jgi:hypothetical protein